MSLRWTLTLDAADAAGAPLLRRQITFEVTELTPALDPFDRPMQWLFRFDRDFFTVSSTEKSTGELTLDSVLGSDGEPDFAQELREIGAQGRQNATGAASVTGRGKTGANAIYHRWIVDAIIKECYRYYEIGPDGTPQQEIALTIFAQDDPEAPLASSFSDTGDFSMMRFGGFFSDGALGYSSFAVYNEGRMGDNTNSHHADYPGLNLMQAGGNLISVLTNALDKIEYPNRTSLIDLALIFAGENRLSPYSRAYLNRRLIYRDFNGKRRPPVIRCFLTPGRSADRPSHSSR